MRTTFLLRESLSLMTPTEQRVAEHILSLGDKLPKTSIGEIAEACATGKSVVVQTCKKAGYKGFKDLCSAYSVSSAVSRYQPTRAYIDVYPGVPEQDICRIVANRAVQAIEDTVDLIDRAEMRRAVDAVVAARRILLVGTGGSGTVAQDTHQKLLRIGFDAHFMPDVHCQQLAVIPLDERDVVIAFSASGQTVNVVEAAELAKERGVKVITVTHLGESALGALADVRINVAGGGMAMHMDTLASRQSMLTAMDMLVTCAAGRNYEQAMRYLENAKEFSRRLRAPKRSDRAATNEKEVR